MDGVDVKTEVEASVPDSCVKIAKLKEELKSTQADLQLAAEFGKSLLEENTALKDQLDNNMKESASKMEDLEQERYSLQLKLNQRTKMEENYVEEVENLKAALQRQKQQHEEFIEAEHSNKITEFRSQLTAQQAELEQVQLSCRQLSTEKEQLETILQETQAQLEQKINVMNETSSEELATLHSDLNALQNEKIALTKELSSARNMEEQYQHTLQRAQSQLAEKEQELEEKQAQATSYYNTLEKAREEIQDLKVQLDVARMESQSVREKGNSLFGEVEDRRVVVEKELISYKVKLASLTKQLQITKQHEHAIKMQLSMLLQKVGHTADKHHMERLQQLLQQANSEVLTLSQKLEHLENQPQKQDPKAELYNAWSAQMSKDDPTKIVFFEKLLEAKKEKIESLETELKTKRLVLVAADQKVLNYEGKLYETERQLERQRDANIKLQVKIDDLKMKYEPERHAAKRTTKGNVEKIPLSKDEMLQQGTYRAEVVSKENVPQVTTNTQHGDKKVPSEESNIVTSAKLSDSESSSSNAVLQSKSGPKPLSGMMKCYTNQKIETKKADDVDVIIKSSEMDNANQENNSALEESTDNKVSGVEPTKSQPSRPKLVMNKIDKTQQEQCAQQ